MDQMMGNLFYRGVQPPVINNMSFFEMREWNKWHEIMAKADKKVSEKLADKGNNNSG